MTDKMTDKDQCNCRKPREDCSIHCELRLRLEKVLGSIEDAMIEHGMTLEEVGGSTILFGFIKEVQEESHEKGRNKVMKENCKHDWNTWARDIAKDGDERNCMKCHRREFRPVRRSYYEI